MSGPGEWSAGLGDDWVERQEFLLVDIIEPKVQTETQVLLVLLLAYLGCAVSGEGGGLESDLKSDPTDIRDTSLAGEKGARSASLS